MSYVPSPTVRSDTGSPMLSEEQINSMLMAPSPATSIASNSPYPQQSSTSKPRQAATANTPLLQPHLMPTFAKMNDVLTNSNNDYAAGRTEQKGDPQPAYSVKGNREEEEEEDECCSECTVG